MELKYVRVPPDIRFVSSCVERQSSRRCDVFSPLPQSTVIKLRSEIVTARFANFQCRANQNQCMQSQYLKHRWILPKFGSASRLFKVSRFRHTLGFFASMYDSGSEDDECRSFPNGKVVHFSQQSTIFSTGFYWKLFLFVRSSSTQDLPLSVRACWLDWCQSRTMVSKVDRTVCPSLQTFCNRSSALGEKFGQQITERFFRVRVMLPL